MINITKYFEVSKEILGMNERMFSYLPLNRGRSYIADDKIITNQILKEAGIPTPNVIAVIRDHDGLEKFKFNKLPSSFVLKPSDGFKGAGINIYYNHLKDGRWILADRTKHDVDGIKKHVLDILDGQYSLASKTRKKAAVFEERIQMINQLRPFSYRGIPDIRVVVYKSVPVMAMLRLPTPESHGTANLNRGAIGVGIDMARGVTTSAIKNGKIIETVPGTNLRLSGIKIPGWDKILKLSSRCQVITKLGFMGVDIIIDRSKGPLVVELNARPGLSIQVANQAGLKDRLQKVNKLKQVSEDRAVRISKDLFGGEIEEEIENISGKEIIGLREDIILTAKDGTKIKAKCKIDTGAQGSSIDYTLLRELGYGSAIDYFRKVVPEGIESMDLKERSKITKKLKNHEEIDHVIYIKSASGNDYRMLVTITAKIRDKEFLMKVTAANRSHLTEPVLIGVSDLKYFFIDATKKKDL